MTWSKYRRLCLVLVLPLLIAGYICAQGFWPYDRNPNILCVLQFNKEYCSPSGPIDAPFYTHQKERIGSWFSVEGFRDQSSYLYFYPQASVRVIDGATILSVTPLQVSTTTPDGELAAKALIGKPASVGLGNIPKDASSSLIFGTAFLFCNTLLFTDQPATYTATCYGRNWMGPVTFSVVGKDRPMLDGLRDAVEKTVDEQKTNYVLYRFITYPIFAYGFLVLSLLCWMVARATRFVRAG